MLADVVAIIGVRPCYYTVRGLGGVGFCLGAKIKCFLFSIDCVLASGPESLGHLNVLWTSGDTVSFSNLLGTQDIVFGEIDR